VRLGQLAPLVQLALVAHQFQSSDQLKMLALIRRQLSMQRFLMPKLVMVLLIKRRVIFGFMTVRSGIMLVKLLVQPGLKGQPV
jgi:hypothetical protein